MKPQKRKLATQKPSKLATAWLVAILIIPVLALLFVAAPSVLSRFIPNSNLVSDDKHIVQRELKEQLELVTLNDQIVLDGTQDQRCVDQSGFLEVRYVCNVQGWKYAKTNGSPGGALRQLDARLTGSGYERLNFSGQSDAHF